MSDKITWSIETVDKSYNPLSNLIEKNPESLLKGDLLLWEDEDEEIVLWIRKAE